MSKQTLVPVVGAFREVDVTPLGWHPPKRGTEQAYIDVLNRWFPDMVEFTMGPRVRTKLQVVEGEPWSGVAERAKRARGELYGVWQRDSREEALDRDQLEEIRRETIALVEGTTSR